MVSSKRKAGPGALNERPYLRLQEAAELLGGTVDDLMHLALIGQLRLGVLPGRRGYRRVVHELGPLRHPIFHPEIVAHRAAEVETPAQLLFVPEHCVEALEAHGEAKVDYLDDLATGGDMLLPIGHTPRIVRTRDLVVLREAVQQLMGGSTKSIHATGHKSKKWKEQELAILAKLEETQLTPTNLPTDYLDGKGGTKAAVRESLCNSNRKLFQSDGVFDKAWSRLLQQQRIRRS